MVNLIDPKPVINVITGIANPEREAFVARTLFESGKNIIFRAISGVELLQCLENRAPENGRWIVVFADDLPGIETIDIANWNDSETSIIDLSNLKNDLELNSLNELIARSLRNPLVHASNQTFLNKTPRYRSLIGIIGSAGAPGRTSITLNLAAETSQKYQLHPRDEGLDRCHQALPSNATWCNRRSQIRQMYRHNAPVEPQDRP